MVDRIEPAAPGSADTARPPIAVLPPEVAARIAAGEVIERPASVVKELVENALDAGARRVEVATWGGGIERLRVRDDGCGIPPEQLADAFERHATSKLRSEHDLFTVRTLGFRGEALAAIAAAADIDCTTRPRGQPAAAVARLRNGRLAGTGSAAAAPGTTVEVRELFEALPARRRFLRSARAEARAVAQVVSDYALACPTVAFRLESEGRAVLSTPGDGTLADAVAAVYGAEVAAALLPLAGRREAEDARVEVEGATGAPSLHRANRRYLHLVANGRTIVSRPLLHAIEQAYEGLLPGGRHPLAVVRVTVPPEQIDVNVHPAKTEVRFRHERLIYATVTAAVREALIGAAAPAAPLPAAPTPGRAVVAGARLATPRLERADGGVGPFAQGVDRPVPAAVAAQQPLPLRERLPALRPLGQLDRTYLVAEAPDGLTLIDQHAAHERVRYEELLAARAAGRPQSQPLLAAAVVSLSPAQLALAQQQAEDLAALGWELAETDGAALIVRAVPALLAAGDPGPALADYLDRLEAEERLSGPERSVATLACRTSVRAGDLMDMEQQRALLLALERSEAPLTCPHGRPTVLHLSAEELARSFGRR